MNLKVYAATRDGRKKREIEKEIIIRKTENSLYYGYRPDEEEEKENVGGGRERPAGIAISDLLSADVKLFITSDYFPSIITSIFLSDLPRSPLRSDQHQAIPFIPLLSPSTSHAYGPTPSEGLHHCPLLPREPAAEC